MYEALSSFLWLREPNVRTVVAGVLLLSMLSAVVGCFTFLRKRSLVGDAISHSVLPGVCLAFIVSGAKNPLVFLFGAILSGLLSVILMEYLSKSRLARTDTAISLLLSSFFGLGIMMLTAIQHSGNAAQAGLDKFLFGKAASITRDDVQLLFIAACVVLLTIGLLFRGFALMAFDEDFARSAGFPHRVLRWTLSVLTVVVVALGIQAVGVVLMAALLITPALAARFWTDSLRTMVWIAALFGMLSGYSGALVSFLAPAMPTGPWIVVVASLIAVVSMVVAPGKGVLSRWLVHRGNRLKMLDENVLKLFYHLGERTGNFEVALTTDDLLQQRALEPAALEKGLQRLARCQWIVADRGAYRLQQTGLREAQRVVRLHRLWELYLQRYLHLQPDHVHDDAEAMEHVITPEIEAQLEALLGNPETDPHNTRIPPRL